MAGIGVTAYYLRFARACVSACVLLAERQPQRQPALLWHAEISRARKETDQGAAMVQPVARVGPKAVPMRTLLFMYQIAVWRVLGLNSR